MKGKNCSVSLFLPSKVFLKGTNLSPINITINMTGGIQFRIRLKLYATKIDFMEALSGKGGNNEVRELRKEMHEYVNKAETILDRLPNPTKETFTRLFKSEINFFNGNKTDITYLYNETIKEMKNEERLSTAIGYQTALNSLLRYKNPIFFESVDATFIKGYITSMTNQGTSKTTAHIYLRTLKAMFNRAIKAGFISQKNYPFQHFTAGTSTKSKDVLYPEQIKRLFEYQPIGVRETRAKEYFFFSYLCNGMNFKDVVYLKYSNIKGDMLSFVREKTKHTTKNEKEIKVYLHPEAKAIIERLGNKPITPSTYIFPIINGRTTYPAMETARKRNRRVMNKMLTAIGKKLGFDVHVCLGIARHSFATALKIKGTPIAFISEAMGHTSSTTTEHYLKSLPDANYKVMSESLLAF
jgi:integrase/recombinase XerD